MLIDKLLKIFCFVTKLMGIALLSLILLVFIGEGPPNPFKLSSGELFSLTYLLIASTGLVIVLWQQLIGGIAILTGMVLFGESQLWIFWVFISLGMLNILCWLLKRLRKTKGLKNE